ncbi:MAG: hypothetical protein ABR510_01395 [Trueperaceae bacterium]
MVERPPTSTEPAPPPTPPDAVPTTVEELPADFWEHDGPSAPPPAAAERREADADDALSPRATPPPAATGDATPPALASLQGMALLQAVFPGRVTKVERSAPADGDAVPDEVAIPAPIEDDPDPGADAPLPRTP